MTKFLTLFLTFTSVTAVAQVAPAIVNPPDAPLQIVSITSNMSDFLHIVQTKNTSNRSISSFQLGIIMAVPEGCGPKEVFGPERLMQTDRVTVAPGAKESTSDYRLSPKEVTSFRVENNARVVQTQLAVVRVNFFDGGSWSPSSNDAIYDRKLMQENASLQCSNSTKALHARAAVQANCVSLIRSAFQDGSGTQTYSCGTGKNQVCAVAADGQSCTTSFCTGGCPNQTCVATGGGGGLPSQPPSGDSRLLLLPDQPLIGGLVLAGDAP